MPHWNPRDTLPRDGTKVRVLWSNGEEDIAYFDAMRADQADEWREQHPELYAIGGEWSSDFGNGHDSDADPIGWLPLSPNAANNRKATAPAVDFPG